MQTKLVIFDWDGTLVDSLPVWSAAVLKKLHDRNISVTAQDLIKKNTLSHFDRVAEFGIRDLDVFGNEVYTEVIQHAATVQLKAGALNTLKTLHSKSLKLAIVTSSFRVFFEPAFAALNLQPFIAQTVTGEEVSVLKPNPEGILRVLKLHNLMPEEAVMVGDTSNDILAGKNAGVKTIAYFPNEHESIYPRDQILRLAPNHIVRSLKEIINLV